MENQRNNVEILNDEKEKFFPEFSIIKDLRLV